MSESVSFPEDSHGENKLFGKPKWRGKLFSADGRFGRAAENPESTDDDINNFLHTAPTRPEAGPRSPPAPGIDVTADLNRPSTASVEQDHTIVDVYRKPKPRQNKRLRVRFESAPPAVIGMGGDEAELPSKDVFISFADSVKSERSPTREPSHCNTNDQRTQTHRRSTDLDDKTSFRPSPLQRRPTGIDDEILTEGSYYGEHDQKAVHSAFSGNRNLSPRPRNEERDQDLGSQKRDVKNLPYISASASKGPSHHQSHTQETSEIRSHETTRHMLAPPAEARLANSPRRSEPSEPQYVSQEISSRYYFPPATKDLPELPGARHQSIRQASQDVSHSSEDKPLSLRTVVEKLGDDSLDDFDSRVQRFNDLFRLNASPHVDIMAVPLERWLKIAAWWFLRGRAGLESAMRGKFEKPSTIAPANAAKEVDSSTLKHGYINVAKSWWVLKDVIPKLHEIRRFGDVSMESMVAAIRIPGDQLLAELVAVYLGILTILRALTMSMKRNRRLPPQDLQMQRLESQIFLETPPFSQDIAALMVNNTYNPPTKCKGCVDHPLFPILVGDTERYFCFGNMFVDVLLDLRDDAKSGVHIPCVVSVLRERADWAVMAVVASQDGHVNLVIQSGEHGGLNWHDVQWKIPLRTMQLELSEGIWLHVEFSERDFKTIWGICDYTQRIRKEYAARRGEEIVYESELPIFQCFDCPSFSAEPMKDCRVRLLERKVLATESSGQHGAHDGYRLMVITPPGTKTLSRVNHELGKDSPILFGTHRSKSGNTLLVKVPSSLRISLTFNEARDVELFRSTLTGTLITEEDHCSASLELQNFTINSASTGQDMAYLNASRSVSDLRWHKLRIVKRAPSAHGHDSQSADRSEHIRILADCDSGTVTDRINAGPGGLQVNLSVESLNDIRLLRAAQQDMTWAFADGVLREADMSAFSYMLQSMGTSPSVRTYQFRSLSDLHSFQAMLTGFHVLYDGSASIFSISRRRTVVPIHKRWEASSPRLQIIKQDKTMQLVAFFKDFSHGACMNFVLKLTDSFETFTRSGVSFLRIVDAKFALPKGESDPAKDFVCFDMPEYPGEHDDINIGFDNEQDRDRFANTLPAPVNKMSRMATLRR